MAVGAPASGGTAPGGVGVEPPISIQIGGEERAMREGASGASGVRARVRSGVDRGDKGSEGAGWAIGPAGWAVWPSWPGGFSFSLFVLFVFFSYFSFSVLIHFNNLDIL